MPDEYGYFFVEDHRSNKDKPENPPKPTFDEAGTSVFALHSTLLPNGRFFFYCYGLRVDNERLAASPPGSARVFLRGLIEMLNSDYDFRLFAGACDFGRRTTAGDRQPRFGPPIEVVPGDRPDLVIKSPVVPANTGGESFAVPLERFGEFFGSTIEPIANPERPWPITQYILLHGIGFDLGGEVSIEIDDETQWWTPGCLPDEVQIFSSQSVDEQPMPVTGIIARRIPDSQIYEHGQPRTEVVEKNREIVDRLLATLQLLTDCEIAFVREVICWQANSQVASSIGLRNRHQLRFANSRSPRPRQQRFATSTLRKAAHLAGTSSGQRSAFYHSAIAACAAASYIQDLSVRYMLLWSAVEALLTNVHQGISTNIALSISGLQAVENRVGVFYRVKKLYDSRSGLAHSYSSPTRTELESLIEELYAYLRQIVSAIDRDAPDEKSVLVKSLISKALSAP